MFLYSRSGVIDLSSSCRVNLDVITFVRRAIYFSRKKLEMNKVNL